MKKSTLINTLDEYLRHDAFVSLDGSKNGLQVDSGLDEIGTIGYAVDVTEYIIDRAIQQGVDMIIAHHGLYRGYETPITGIMYQKIKKLLDHDIGVYASHLPLDAHEEVGNNIGLARGRLRTHGIQDYTLEPIGTHKGVKIGRGVRHETPIPAGAVHMPYCQTFGLKNAFYNYGNIERIRSVAFVSGHPGLSAAQECKKHGYDVLVTGEFVHYESTGCKELKQSVLLGGHYETEKIGPKLLAHYLGKTYGLQTVFLDESF